MICLADFFPRKGAVHGGAALLLGLMPSPFADVLFAAEQRPIQLPEQTPRDFVLTSAARRAIQKDEQLASLNLGISVNNKVATIWGTIPSAETARRVEEALKKISGIAAVMNECRIVPNDPVPEAVADAVKKARNQADDPATSAKHSPVPPPAAMTSRVVAKPNADELAPKPKGDVNEVAPGAPLLPTPPATVLLAPIPVEEASDLEDWEAVRRSDLRFKDLTLSVKDGVVRINGVVAKTKDAWDLAGKLNKLPDVKQVIVGNVVEK